MAKYLLMSRPIDFDDLARQTAQGLRPRHVMGELAKRMEMQVIWPTSEDLAWHPGSKLIGQPEHWQMARRLLRQATPQDLILCPGEDVGFPLATLAAAMPRRPRIACVVHNLARPRMEWARRLLRPQRGIDLWMTPSAYQAEHLQRVWRIAAERVHWMVDQTDLAFFRPATELPAPGARAPRLISVGLEQRDYHTLAQAVEGLDVEVAISGFSQDAKLTRRAVPDKLPAQMTRRHYSWPELQALYQSADLAVVSLFANTYCAGVTSLLEAMACRLPILLTSTAGLEGYGPAGLERIPPGDPVQMRQAIEKLLSSPQSQMAQCAYEEAHRRHQSQDWLTAMTRVLEMS